MGDQDRVALVTGANRGLGLETCRQLAERGMKVVLTSRDEEQGRAAARALVEAGLKVDFHPLDVTDDDSVRGAAAYVENTYGRLDVLVNNAGVALEPLTRDAAALTVELSLVGRTFEVNTLGALRVCQAFVPLMQRHGYGRVVNVSSGMGQLEEMNGGAPGYRISKTALNALTRVLSQELAGSGIKVNSVCPGHVATELGGPDAPRSVEDGVDTTLWLATLHDDGPTGGFFRDCKLIRW